MEKWSWEAVPWSRSWEYVPVLKYILKRCEDQVQPAEITSGYLCADLKRDLREWGTRPITDWAGQASHMHLPRWCYRWLEVAAAASLTFFQQFAHRDAKKATQFLVCRCCVKVRGPFTKDWLKFAGFALLRNEPALTQDCVTD